MCSRNRNAFHISTEWSCCFSASGNCDHKNVAVERENHKLFFFSFIHKSCNQYKTIFICRWFSGVQMIPRLAPTTIISEMAVLSSVVWEGGVGKLNEKFRKQFSLKCDSPDNVLPNFSWKCCMRPFVALESLRSNLSNILNAFKRRFIFDKDFVVCEISAPS